MPVIARLSTVAAHLRTLGGRPLHIPDLRIHELVSPQSFVVRAREPNGGRALVLLERAGMRALVPGVEVEIRGRAYTLAGASVEVGWPVALTPEAVGAFARVPVIVAESIRTPGGVRLY